MNPIRANHIFDPNKVTRNVECRHYNECLNTAIRREWSGFSCSECGSFELEGGQDPAYWQEQDMRAACLLLEVSAISTAHALDCRAQQVM